VVYVGNDSEKSKRSPDSVADGLEPSLPDEPELKATKSLTLRDRITSSDAAMMLPPRQTVVATFPSSYPDDPGRQAPGGVKVATTVDSQ